MLAFSLRLGFVLGLMMLLLGNLAIAASIPVSDISLYKSVDARSAATIPVECAAGQDSVSQEKMSSLLDTFCSNLHRKTTAPTGSPVPAGHMISDNLITDWDNHVLVSTFVNNTCNFDFSVPIDACDIEFNAIVDQCSSNGQFQNGTTWYGCLRWSIWVYYISPN